MRHLSAILLVVLVVAPESFAQQANGAAASLLVNFRQGPPYPIVATSPNGGTITVTVIGAPGAPFILAAGTLNVGAIPTVAGSWDLGTPPSFGDVQIIGNGFAPGGSAFTIAPAGISAFFVPVPLNTAIALPPVQALVSDPASPLGLTPTAASQITMLPSKNVLFLQGDFDPGLLGLGPHCRLADFSPVGFAQLRSFLQLAGFLQVDEVVDATVTVTPALLAPYGLLVLGSNQKTFTTPEADAIESFVRAGGGLVSYSDAMFGPGSVPSDNQVLSRFGLLTTYDNFGGVVPATSFVPHPVSAGVTLGIVGEGVSVIEIVGNATDTFTNVAACAANGTACTPYPATAPSGSLTPVYSVCAAVEAGLGKVVATFDRNTFFNPPGVGTNLYQASNLTYALNLFLWAGGY